jgi:hypothetical protein
MEYQIPSEFSIWIIPYRLFSVSGGNGFLQYLKQHVRIDGL